MSMEQIDRYLRACPRATQFPDAQEQYIFHFIYDYFLSPVEFIRHFPNAQPIGIAWLPEWAFHINEKGKANIRKIYFDGKATPEHDYLCPAPATKGELLNPLQKTKGTLGWVFRLDRTDDERLHQEHGITRIRMAQYVKVRIAPENTQFARCSIYFDPRHTSDVPRARNEDPETQIAEYEERRTWMGGLEHLSRSGAPFWYLQMIRNQILGAFRDPEPIFIRPSDLFIKESCRKNPPVPISSPAQVAPEQQRLAQPVREQTKKSGKTPNKKVAGQAQIPDQHPKEPNKYTKRPPPENQANASTRPSTTIGPNVKFVQKKPDEGNPGSSTTTTNGPKKNPPKKRPAEGKQGGSQPKKPRPPPGPSGGQQPGSQVVKRPPVPARRQRRPPPGPSGLCHVETP